MPRARRRRDPTRTALGRAALGRAAPLLLPYRHSQLHGHLRARVGSANGPNGEPELVIAEPELVIAGGIAAWATRGVVDGEGVEGVRIVV